MCKPWNTLSFNLVTIKPNWIVIGMNFLRSNEPILISIYLPLLPYFIIPIVFLTYT